MKWVFKFIIIISSYVLFLSIFSLRTRARQSVIIECVRAGGWHLRRRLSGRRPLFLSRASHFPPFPPWNGLLGNHQTGARWPQNASCPLLQKFHTDQKIIVEFQRVYSSTAPVIFPNSEFLFSRYFPEIFTINRDFWASQLRYYPSSILIVWSPSHISKHNIIL